MAKLSKKIATINYSSCDGSPACPALRMCPEKAIVKEKSGNFLGRLLGFGKAKVISEKCTGCGICINYCPLGIIKVARRES